MVTDYVTAMRMMKEQAGRLVSAGHVVAMVDEVNETCLSTDAALMTTTRLVIAYEDESAKARRDLTRCRLSLAPGDYIPPWLATTPPASPWVASLCVTDLETGLTRTVAATTSYEAAQAAARLLSIP